MVLSRLRLQLALWFALTFLIGLGAADVALFSFLRHRADQALSAAVHGAATDFAQAVRREMADTRGSVGVVAREAYAEFPPDSIGFVVYDSAGARVFTRGPDRLTDLVPPAEQLPGAERTWNVPLRGDRSLRMVEVFSPGQRPFRVVGLIPTTGLERAGAALAWRLSLSVPLVVLLALIAGYFLARRALAPLSAMSRDIAAIAADDLGTRLPVRRPPDELDTLAARFNALMERLGEARARNRRFLARVAHQLRTPLTVIRGESTLSLERPRSAEEHVAVLKRVALAAEQMTHRVNDLFLLAQAEAGERPPLTDRVELDGLVLECVDLMRGRASERGRRFALRDFEPLELIGSEVLLREAVLELIENAVRHGTAGGPLYVGVHGGTSPTVEVAGPGPELPVESFADATESRAEHGLGLSIVRWIAALHGGQLCYRREDGSNVFAIEFADKMTTAVMPPSSAPAIIPAQP